MDEQNNEALDAAYEEVDRLFADTGIDIFGTGDSDTEFVWEVRDITARENLDDVIAAIKFAKAATHDPVTSVSGPGYFEQLISLPSFSTTTDVDPDSLTFDLHSPAASTHCRIQRPSLKFWIAMLRDGPPDAKRFFSEGIETLRRTRYSEDRLDYDPPAFPKHLKKFHETISPGWSVAISNDPGARPVYNLKECAEACLFNHAYATGQAFVPLRSWDPATNRFQRGQLGPIQFPRRVYKSDLVSYYQLALASESALLAYLSLYNVLEYFFSEAEEKALHAKLKNLLVQPDFLPTKTTKLRELTRIVDHFNQRTGELGALQLVIGAHFEPDDLIHWIRDYQNSQGNVYTSQTLLFGKLVPISLGPEGLASSLANRIYHIRNLLVHNKEANSARYVPFSDDDHIIWREVPLISHLAEQLIISTGMDIP